MLPNGVIVNRRKAVVEAYKKYNGDIYECPTAIENEKTYGKSISRIKEAGVMH